MSSAPARGDGPPPGLEGKELDLCPHARAAERALAEPPFPLARETDAETDVLHYVLEIEILPQNTAVGVQGTCTIGVASLSPALTRFTVDLRSNLTVSGVAGDVASWSRVGDTVVINLNRAYAVGEVFEVAVSYSGNPQGGGFGGFLWWTRNGALVVGTLSEPYYARNWWPCKDSLGDKATMQMQVTVPNGLVVASNGLSEGSIALSANRTQWLWHETYPMMPYLASLAITNYQRYDLQFPYDDGSGPQTMPVWCYLYPDHWNFGLGQPGADYKAGCDELISMLTTFSAAYGLYPFTDEKYGVAEMDQLGANMEHQTIASMVAVRNNSQIMAHELAHHWWGDMITCATWYDIWLNEGFASYSEAIFEEQKVGGGAAGYWQRINSRKPSAPNAQVYRTSIATINDIFSGNDVYNKGAWVLHMLRGVIGDDAFFTALADYRAAHEHDSASTAQFAADLSASFGADLTWFIQQWVMEPGSPAYEWNYAATTLSGQSWLKIRIAQTQSGSYGLFTMPVRLRVTSPAGVETVTVWNDELTGHYVAPIAAAPTAVEFDRADGVSNRNWILAQSVTKVTAAVAAPPVLLRADWTPFAADATHSTLALQFSENIAAFDASDFTFVGEATGAHAATQIAYNAATQTATLTFTGLPLDRYGLTLIASGIVANSKPLDGEVSAATLYDTTLLPSGDGQAGGNAVLAFTRHAGDFDGDGDVGPADAQNCLACLTGPLGGPVANGCHACDFNADDDVDLRDAASLFEAFSAP